MGAVPPELAERPQVAHSWAEPKGKGRQNKMAAGTRLSWQEEGRTSAPQETGGRSSSYKEEELMKENSKLKKTIKRMRAIMEKKWGSKRG